MPKSRTAQPAAAPGRCGPVRLPSRTDATAARIPARNAAFRRASATMSRCHRPRQCRCTTGATRWGAVTSKATRVSVTRAATRIGAPFATRTGSTHWTRCRRPPPGAVPKRSSSTKSSSNQNATPFRTPSSPASNARRASRAASAASTSAAQKSSSAQDTGGARSRYAPARACIEPSRSSSSDPGPHRYRSSAARGTPCDAGNRAASGAQKTRARAGTTTHSGTARWRRAWRT